MHPLINRMLTHVQLTSFRSTRSQFYRDLAKAFEMDESLPVFLEAELAISRNKATKNSSRAAALKIMLQKVRAGDDLRLTKTIGSVMPQTDGMLLTAVEHSASRAETLRALADAVEGQAEAKKLIYKQLATPLIMLPGMAALAYVLSSKSLPIIAKVAPPEVWTPFNAAVRNFANFLNNYGLLIALLAVGFAGVLTYLLPRWTSPLRMKAERFNPRVAVWLTPIAPWLLPLSLYRDFQAGMMISALAVLLKTGKGMKDSLEAIRSNSSPWMRMQIRRILRHLDEYPTEASKAFSKGLLSQSLMARLATMTRNAKFDDVLITVGTEGSVAIREQVATTAKKLNFIFLTLVASVVLFLYVGQMVISATMQDEMDPIKRTQRIMEKRQGVQHHVQ
jgi:type II secretory pathway component PulF